MGRDLAMSLSLVQESCRFGMNRSGTWKEARAHEGCRASREEKKKKNYADCLPCRPFDNTFHCTTAKGYTRDRIILNVVQNWVWVVLINSNYTFKKSKFEFYYIYLKRLNPRKHIVNDITLFIKSKFNSVALFRKWTIPTERSPLVGSVTRNSDH
jgi:hypothetical protein